MQAVFKPVVTDDECKQLATLASEIWHEYWPDRIGLGQTDYMVELFQSYEAITRDMRENKYEYWFICAPDDGRRVGYTGGHVEEETNRFFISKIYLLADERGKGFASSTIKFYEGICRERNLHAMYLTVNKENDLAIRAYLGTGFTTIDATVSDIGGGYYMDDYIMEKTVDQPLA